MLKTKNGGLHLPLKLFCIQHPGKMLANFESKKKHQNY